MTKAKIRYRVPQGISVLHSFAIYGAFNLNKTFVFFVKLETILVVEFAAQIEHVSSLEAITELLVNRNGTVPFSSLLFTILLRRF